MSQQSEFQQTTTNAGLIGLTAFGGAIVGFLLQLIVAFHFGAGSNTDAFFMAASTSELLSKFLLGGSITAVFLPMFVERLTRNERLDAWQLALNLIHLTSAVFVIAIASIYLFAEQFVHLIADGFDPTTSALTVNLLRVLLPSFLFLFLAELITSMLHALKQFAIPALLRVIAPVVSIVSVLLLVNQIGIYSLAIGALAGSIIQVSFLSWGLHKQGFSYQFVFKPFDSAIKHLLKLVAPFVISLLVTTVAAITYRSLVSNLTPGSLASLKFAEKITQMLVIIFLNSVTLVIYPTLSEKAANQDWTGIKHTIASAIRLITFITLPIVVGVALLRDPIIAFIYQRGSFSPEDAAMTSVALLFLVIGLTTNGISSVLGHTVLALQKTSAAVAITTASQVVAISLFVVLVPLMDHAGLALASSLVPLSSAFLYYWYLHKKIPNLSSIFIHHTYLKTIILTVIMGILVFYTNAWLDTNRILQVFVPTILGATAFFIGAHIWKIQEMTDVSAIVEGKLKKWRA